MDAKSTDLSILIPAHNERAGLQRLIPAICEVMSAWDSAIHWELIVVDDGSTDGTGSVVEPFAKHDVRIKLFRILRQSGQSTALAAAVDRSSGRWLATLDADGQNDPADLPILWQLAVRSDADAVLGWREKRQDNRRTRWISRLSNRVRNRVLGQNIRDTGCSTRLMRADLVRELPQFEGWHRFLGPMLAARGARIEQTPVRHHARSHGRSHYNWRNRGIRVIGDLLGVAWLNRRQITKQVQLMAELPDRYRVDAPHDISGQPNKTQVQGQPVHSNEGALHHERLV